MITFKGMSKKRIQRILIVGHHTLVKLHQGNCKISGQRNCKGRTSWCYLLIITLQDKIIFLVNYVNYWEQNTNIWGYFEEWISLLKSLQWILSFEMAEKIRLINVISLCTVNSLKPPAVVIYFDFSLLVFATSTSKLVQIIIWKLLLLLGWLLWWGKHGWWWWIYTI